MRFKIYQLIMNILVIQIQLTFIQCTSFRKVLVKQKVITHTYNCRCHVINTCNYNFWFQSLKWYSVHETENIKFLLFIQDGYQCEFSFSFCFPSKSSNMVTFFMKDIWINDLSLHFQGYPPVAFYIQKTKRTIFLSCEYPLYQQTKVGLGSVEGFYFRCPFFLIIMPLHTRHFFHKDQQEGW